MRREWETPWGSIFFGETGCPGCTGNIPTKNNNLAVKFPELLLDWDWENNKSPYDYLPHSKKRVNWICHECGNKWISYISMRTSSGCGCHKCSLSSGENFISSFFDEEIFCSNRNINTLIVKERQFTIDFI